MRSLSIIAAAHLLPLSVLAASPAQADPERCGEVVTLATHAGSTTRYALAQPHGSSAPIALVLLAGGGGYLDLDGNGCARLLKGNSLVRSLPLFQHAGLATALLDAPSDYAGADGLAGFRDTEQHAQDIGQVIADVRARTGASVWLIGTSRGTISAANAAARLSGAAAPDGLVLTSALMLGSQGKKSWVARTVFDLPLEAIRMPLLVVGHAADQCLRSPAALMARIAARSGSARRQVVTVTGGPGGHGAVGVEACAGRAPHGFIQQEDEVAAGIVRFIRGGRYER